MTVDDPDELRPGVNGDRQRSPEDAEVRASRGSAFGEFYVRHKGYIENYIRKQLYLSNCPTPATHFEEVTGDVFTRAQKSLHTFREEEGSYLNWVFAISRNLVKDHVRGACSHEVSLEALTSSAEETGRLPFAEPRAPREDYDKLIWLNDKLKRMPEKYRQVLLLVGHGYDYEEVAKRMGVTANHARQLCFKARRMLRAED
jgi:RNA polymerase sigma factor (sigma-70 family)